MTDSVKHICEQWISAGYGDDCFWESFPDCPSEDSLTPNQVMAAVAKLEAENVMLREAAEHVAGAAKGMSAEVALGDGASATIIDPRSFTDGGPEWVMRYGNPNAIRFVVASLLESYDGLLSDHIPTHEAVRRLRLMRSARAALNREGQT